MAHSGCCIKTCDKAVTKENTPFSNVTALSHVFIFCQLNICQFKPAGVAEWSELRNLQRQQSCPDPGLNPGWGMNIVLLAGG